MMVLIVIALQSNWHDAIIIKMALKVVLESYKKLMKIIVDYFFF